MPSDIKKVNEKSGEAFLDFGGLIKHAARHLLWLPEAKALRGEKNRFLKYFTLPGKLAWDIFFFERNNIIQRQGRGFPGVRFCDNNKQYYTEAKKILGSTIGKMENFESLVLDNHKEFWDGFPYDLYNLDFCGTCFPDNQPPFSNSFRAIEEIIKKHVETNHFPFIIFLTMKALDSQTNEAAKRELQNNIETNRANTNFTRQIDELIPDIETFINNNFDDFIIVSIPKIICHLSETQCDIEVKARAKYSRSNPTNGNYFITKFVFKFIRRRQKTLKIRNDNYISNILKIMRLDNVQIINDSNISAEIRMSHKKLKDYIYSFITGE